jgi:hypothetical protein
MEKNVKKYKCDCGEININKFYLNNKSICKKCKLEKLKIKYKNLSDVDKKNKIKKQGIWISKNIIKCRVLAAKHRSIRKNIDFDIDEEFISDLLKKQNYRCFYSNIILDISSIGSENNNINNNTLSIDRIDSNKGYLKDNVVLVTGLINLMKNDLSDNEFRNIIKILYSNISTEKI